MTELEAIQKEIEMQKWIIENPFGTREGYILIETDDDPDKLMYHRYICQFAFEKRNKIDRTRKTSMCDYCPVAYWGGHNPYNGCFSRGGPWVLHYAVSKGTPRDAELNNQILELLLRAEREVIEFGNQFTE